MMKKILGFVLVLVMVLSMAAVSASACSANASDQAKVVTLDNKVNHANKDIAKAVAKAQKKDGDKFDKAWLLSETGKIIASVRSYAASIGATLGCTDDQYIIDGEVVIIDPLFVINYGD